MHYNFNANVHQSFFSSKFIADENTLTSKLGVSYKNMNLSYATVLLWSSRTVYYYYYYLFYPLLYFKFNCLYSTF
jgi:hypothetical protein